jgi:hypothetical protein
LNDINKQQKEVCIRNGSSFVVSEPSSKLGIAVASIENLPLNALRHKPEGDTCGWYIWGGEELSEDADFFKPLHVSHIRDYCPELEKYLKMNIEENIKKHGWQFQYVFDEKGQKEDFGYSIGFEESYKHPEIMIFGLKRETMHALLSDLASDIKAGRVFEPNNKIGNIVDNDYEVIFKPLKESMYQEYAGTAERYYQKPFRVYVMFWPDKNNVLPTEIDCKLTVQNEALKIV